MFVVIFVLFGSAYCRSLPTVPVPNPTEVESVDVASLNGSPTALVRKARQFGNNFSMFAFRYRTNIVLFPGYYNNYDYNPYNDTPNNYDGTPFNDTPHRQIYNNFDFNPFNDSPNNYDANPFNDSTYFGKRK